MTNIVYMKFGSHLYGTDTTESDIDYKGIYMPTRNQIYLNDIPRTLQSSTGKNNAKNQPGDIDKEIFSLHYFIKLACEGQTVALDMLHAPANMIIEKTNIWDDLVSKRHMFYTKDLKAFVSYCRKQAAKYGLKGSRLSDSRKVLDFIHQFPSDTPLVTLWEDLPTGDHIHKLLPEIDDTNQYRMYQVCGKKFQENTKLRFIVDCLDQFIKNYGHRAELAAKNEGIDWKAMSHAVRAALQVEEILKDGTITFPLKQAEYVRAIKCGNLSYSDEVAPLLENLMDEVEQLSKESKYPNRVDQNFWNNWILHTLHSNL